MQQKPRTIGTDGSQNLFDNVQETNMIHRLGEPDEPKMARTVVDGPLTRGATLPTVTHTHLGVTETTWVGNPVTVDLCGGNLANPGLSLIKK